mmetsp:Transcript_60683/g.149210  ORF Transcript_60683/g.149210 Transcript_60683/m.149210 type:complete len:215 (+) Transcript_60683:274-918(+)
MLGPADVGAVPVHDRLPPPPLALLVCDIRPPRHVRRTVILDTLRKLIHPLLERPCVEGLDLRVRIRNSVPRGSEHVFEADLDRCDAVWGRLHGCEIEHSDPAVLLQKVSCQLVEVFVLHELEVREVPGLRQHTCPWVSHLIHQRHRDALEGRSFHNLPNMTQKANVFCARALRGGVLVQILAHTHQIVHLKVRLREGIVGPKRKPVAFGEPLSH